MAFYPIVTRQRCFILIFKSETKVIRVQRNTFFGIDDVTAILSSLADSLIFRKIFFIRSLLTLNDFTLTSDDPK
jgi:hypothetical protein